MFCKSCGKRLDSAVRTCPHCGSVNNPLVGGHSFRDILLETKEAGGGQPTRHEPQSAPLPVERDTLQKQNKKKGRKYTKINRALVCMRITVLILCAISVVSLIAKVEQIDSRINEYSQKQEEMRIQQLEERLTKLEQSIEKPEIPVKETIAPEQKPDQEAFNETNPTMDQSTSESEMNTEAQSEQSGEHSTIPETQNMDESNSEEAESSDQKE